MLCISHCLSVKHHKMSCVMLQSRDTKTWKQKLAYIGRLESWENYSDTSGYNSRQMNEHENMHFSPLRCDIERWNRIGGGYGRGSSEINANVWTSKCEINGRGNFCWAHAFSRHKPQLASIINWGSLMVLFQLRLHWNALPRDTSAVNRCALAIVRAYRTHFVLTHVHMYTLQPAAKVRLLEQPAVQ